MEWLASEKPDWVILSNALLLGMGRRIREATGAKIACTLQGEDGFLDALGKPYSEQCWQLVGERGSEFDALIPVSRYHSDLMQKRAQLPAADAGTTGDACTEEPTYDGVATDETWAVMLDNVDNLQASWVTQGPGVAQASLYMGSNDFGSVMLEENVVSAAGSTWAMNVDEVEHHIRVAGFIPVRRNMRYDHLEVRDGSAQPRL